MRHFLVLAGGAAVLLACSGPTEPAQPLDGAWKLDSSSAGRPPLEMTLFQQGTSITGAGSAMGVDAPIPLQISGTYTPPVADRPAAVTLQFAYQNGGGVTAQFEGVLTGDRLAGTVVYYGLTSDPVSGQLSFTRPQPADSLLLTGLEGTVRRGPIMPVCQVGVPCDAPFSATFQVSQGQRLVARFHSDSAGHYLVLLPPGGYVIAPDAGSPGFLSGQTREATVWTRGLTHLDLEFDTGIR
jgi:hypothetical protein